MTFQNGDPVEVLLKDEHGTPTWVPGTYQGTLAERSPTPHLVSVDRDTLQNVYGPPIFGEHVRSMTLHFADNAVRSRP